MFRLNQLINLPELADHLGLPTPQFRVAGRLRGGMGECFCVVHGDTSFALKIIRRDIIDDSDAWFRYLREVRLWTTLSAYEGVAEALCLIQVDELPVVCSRWMNGGNLRQHFANRSPEFFFSVMARIVGTLAWVHQEHTVIHRDLKPDNILLDDANQAYVSDWGLARPLTVSRITPHPPSLDIPNSERPELTQAGGILGTIAYASPEQLKGKTNLDHRTDIYSLGCLMYEWEKGVRPFTGKTAHEILLKQLFDTPAPLCGFFKRTTFGAEDLIRRCLEKDPNKRPPDYASLDRLLKDAAKKRNVNYSRFFPSTRYKIPMIGEGAFVSFLESHDDGHRADDSYRIADRSELEPFMREAETLMAIGDYKKAMEILSSLFVPEMVTKTPDYGHNQWVSIGYAICLIRLGRADEGVRVLECLSEAKNKPAEYFVNYSLALIRTCDYESVIKIAHDGLQSYPDDPDLVGNLCVAQTAVGAYLDAFDTAKIVLERKRDVHSLRDVGSLYHKYAESVRETDWPRAVENLRRAVGFLVEAKNRNPRHLTARFELVMALESMTAYTQCMTEVEDILKMDLHHSDRVGLTYFAALCLDRVNSYSACVEFCNERLNEISKIKNAHSNVGFHVVKIERVRARAIADGFCIGKLTESGARVIVPDAVRFFERIVLDERMRRPGDFCYLARFREWTGRYDDAEAILEQGESLYAEDWEIPFCRASIRWRAGDYDGAIDPAERAVALAPWRAQPWRVLGMVQEGLGRSRSAKTATDRAQEVEDARERLTSGIIKSVRV